MMEKTTVTLGEIVENNEIIFDFEYPFYNENYRSTFEKHFIEHFYFDEIGLETVSRFKQRLKIKLNLIMPYWNKIFLADELEQRILDNYDVTETYSREVKNISTATNESSNKNLQSETPLTKVDVEQVDYYSNIVKDIGNNKSNVNNDSVENWKRNIQGNYGVQTDSEAIVKYWDSLRKIEKEIFEECSSLFMEVW